MNNKNVTFSTQHSFGTFHKKSIPNNFMTWTQLTSWQRSLPKKIKSAIKPSDLIYSVVEAYSSFHNMKQLGALLLPPPPELEASPLLGYPSAFHQATTSLTIHQYPFILLHIEKHCENNVTCLRTQYDDATQIS